MSVIDEIAAERRRQRVIEGWSLAHDDSHKDGEMSRAAACYAAHASAYQRVASDVGLDAYAAVEPRASVNSIGWPWYREWWKPRNPRRDLIRAAALIVAEIERLDRAASRTPQVREPDHG